MDPSSSAIDSPEASLKIAHGRNQASMTDGKRNKTSHACVPCRKRKVKCDGTHPCARCQKSSLDCEFSKGPPKRDPPKLYVETHEPRLRAVERALATIALDEAVSVSVESGPCSSSSSSASLPSSPDDSMHAMAGIHACQDRLAVGPTGQGLYVPDWPARIDRIPSVYGSLTEIEREPHDVMGPPFFHHGLVQAYFDYVHPHLPILHRSTFYHQIGSNHPPSAFLVNAMQALASRWHTPGPSEHQPQGVAMPSGWRYYQAALKLLDGVSDAPRLSTVQALLLLVKYHEHVRRPGLFSRTRLYLEILVRMVMDLGLMRELPSNGPINTIQAEIHKRTFWAVYAYDMMHSTEQGTSPHFTSKQCTVDFPSLLADEVQTPDQDALMYFNWTAKIMRAQGAVLHLIRQKYNTQRSGDEVLEESKQLTTLQDHVDEMERTMAALLVQRRRSGQIYAVNAVRLALDFVTILLHRPYALSPAGSSPVDPTQHRERCFVAALSITRTTEMLAQDCQQLDCLYYPMRGVQQLIHYLSAAITVHRDLRHHPQAAEAYVSSLRLMKRLVEWTPVVELHPLALQSGESFTKPSPSSPTATKLRRTNTVSGTPRRSSRDLSLLTQSSAVLTTEQPLLRQAYRQAHRLSAPPVGTYSQPPSPTPFGAQDHSYTPSSSPIRRRKSAQQLASPATRLRRSSSFVHDVGPPGPRPAAPATAVAMRHTYMHPASAHRRHTVSGQQPNLNLHAMATMWQAHHQHTRPMSSTPSSSSSFDVHTLPHAVIPPTPTPPSASMQPHPISQTPLTGKESVLYGVADPDASAQSMMGLLMDQDTHWDFS